MGYILPFNHYQYDDYKNRTIQTERSPFILDEIHKVELKTKLEERKAYQNKTGESDEPSKLNLGKKQMQSHSSMAEKIYSQITGKGKHFSETI
ncbi:hypothetical protein LCL89_06880 [Halobacillus yeomjeoni]|uniref:hypothetical protein n=1 Tax=Halobacillus yeomjeoni TaxID=311194 RepID=UPI001CD1D096|nr:hypothetical protein [Halobacillus yeomjeoni]MCA0983780.1 hypothetical protein [Halobacillus yeomjeoni]